jgi:outer membrane protein assembly factor BamB
MLVNETLNQPLNPTLTFLRGEILHVDTEAKRIIIKHFETTEAKQHEFILVAVDLEGKFIWEKRRKDFACFDFFSFWSKYDFHRSQILDNKMILTFGGFVYALSLQNGEKIWENRL